VIEKSAEAALAYLAAPSICVQCNDPILLNGRKPSIVRKQRFCCKSCATSHRQPKQIIYDLCQRCGTTISYGSHSYKKYCMRCRRVVMSEKASARHGHPRPIGKRTKAEVLAMYASYASARNAIRDHATKQLRATELPYQCSVPKCGYTKHNDVCHKKSVASFGGSAKIAEINALENLFYLCPTHHWEHDNIEPSLE